MIITYETHDIDEKMNAIMSYGCFAGCCVNIGRGGEY